MSVQFLAQPQPLCNFYWLPMQYIISEGLFEGLPQEEKKYWHSHAYEVTSGQLVAKNIPTALENIEMAKVSLVYAHSGLAPTFEEPMHYVLVLLFATSELGDSFPVFINSDKAIRGFLSFPCFDWFDCAKSMYLCCKHRKVDYGHMKTTLRLYTGNYFEATVLMHRLLL
eukprot:1148104-Pelagomonas_calceolata.AAC.4